MEIEVKDYGTITKEYPDSDWWVSECDHSEVEYGDDSERGVCQICGATCDWVWETDVEDNYPDSITEIKVQSPQEWYEPEKKEGLLWEVAKAFENHEIKFDETEYKGHLLTISLFDIKL